MDQVTAAEARTVLARAFAEDPLMAWFFPDDETRVHACAALFGLFAEHYLVRGRVDVVRSVSPVAVSPVAASPVAVAMWRWPAGGDDEAAPDEVLPSVPGLMTALMGPDRAARVGGAMAGIADLRPPEPHAYLHVLGVEPALRGRGLGSEVLRRGLAAARAGGLVACLETMNAANVPFYQRHGFGVRSEVRLDHDGPTVWAMATPSTAG